MNKLPFDERIIKWVDICCNKGTSPIDSQSHGLQIRNGYYLFIFLILKINFIRSLIIMKQTKLHILKLLNLKILKPKVEKSGTYNLNNNRSSLLTRFCLQHTNFDTFLNLHSARIFFNQICRQHTK